MKISRKTKRLWLNRIIFVAVVAAGIFLYVLYINSATIYDFTRLTQRMEVGEGRPFVPLTGVGQGRVPDMVRAAETPYIALYVNMDDTTFAIHDKRNDNVWHSSPQGEDRIANEFNREVMRSNMGFSFYDANRRRRHHWTYNDSVAYGSEQFEIYAISHGSKQGIRINYEVGNLDLGAHWLPRYLSEEFYNEVNEMILAAGDQSLARFFRGQWHESEERIGFRRLSATIFESIGNTNRMISIFENYLDWDLNLTVEHNTMAGYEPDISFDFWKVTFEILIERDRMYVNVPLDKLTTTSANNLMIYNIDILRFFGAGCEDSEGFMLVPSGAGGVINFNNGKYREVPFAMPMYGVDTILTVFFPQMEQAARLPVIGIQNNGFGFVTHVQSGQGLTFINAEVAAETPGMGIPNAQNNTWFNFHMRSSMPLGMGGIPGAGGDLRVIQENMYDGDITVVYQFIAEEDPGVGMMAQTYQQFLVEEGILTQLDGPGDRTFYLDVLGAVDIRRHFLGVQYDSLEIMTTMDDADRFVDLLNTGGVNNIQMQLHGWFNRGINHDIAKRVRTINAVGNQRDMQNMEARLQADGGGLNPVVNFHLTNWYSRNFRTQLEAARDPSGYVGFMTRIARDMMFTRGTHHRNDWFLLVHPGVVPQHLDSFIPAFERRMGLDGLALADMGDFITESIHRRNQVDREHSRLIAESQLERLTDSFSNLVVFGGNDYSLAFASHIVDAPVESDVFFIIDYEVPFFPMVVHGFIEFAGRPANIREDFHPTSVLLNSMATGASPRYMFTGQPTRAAVFSPHERFYSTHYVNWMEQAVDHYRMFNDVYRHLRGERIVDFIVLANRGSDIMTSRQVTVTVFSNGTRIYVNNTNDTFEYGGVTIPPRWFTVTGGAR